MTLPIPTHSEAMVDQQGRPTVHWRRYLAQIEAQGNAQLASDVEAIARALGSPDGTVANIPPQTELVATLTARNGIRLFGTLASGNVRFELDQLANTGVGAALVKITRDAYGRVEGTQAAFTDDLPESASPTNLYHTAQRVRDTLLTGLSTATNAVITATDSVLTGLGKLQAQVSGIVANYVTTARTIATTAPLTGGGDLSADRTLSISLSATDRLLGRATAGAGPVEEIACTAAGRALLDDADAAAQRVTLELGTAATQDTGTSGATVPLLNAANTFAGATTFESQVTLNGGSLVIDRTGDAAAATTVLAADAGQFAHFSFRTGATPRWQFAKGTGAESGGNAGSDFVVNAFDDAGALIGAAYSITRATRVVNFPVSPTMPTPAAGTNTTQGATTAYAMSAAPNSSYRVLLDSSASHTAARVAGTYGFGQGNPAAISGTGALYALNLIYLDPADYPTVNGLTTKLRVRAVLAVNDVAPTGNFTFGLHPVTRPATSGGAGLCIYTIGAAVAGSTVAVATPAADSTNNAVGADFAIPAAGFYVLGMVTTATVAASSHTHISASLQMRNA